MSRQHYMFTPLDEEFGHLPMTDQCDNHRLVCRIAVAAISMAMTRYLS